MKFSYWNKAKKSFMLIDGILMLIALAICLSAESRYLFTFSGIAFLVACTMLMGFLIINTTCWVWMRSREKNHVPIVKCLRLTLASCTISSLSLWLFYKAVAPLIGKYILVLAGCFTIAGYFLYLRRFLRRNKNERVIYFVFSVILPCVICIAVSAAELIFIRSGELPLTIFTTAVIVLNYAPISAIELTRISVKKVL